MPCSNIIYLIQAIFSLFRAKFCLLSSKLIGRHPMGSSYTTACIHLLGGVFLGSSKSIPDPEPDLNPDPLPGNTPPKKVIYDVR